MSAHADGGPHSLFGVGILIFFPWPSFKTRGHGQGATILLLRGRTTKNGRGFFDKTEARLAPGIVQLYSAVVYRSKNDLLTTPKSNGEKSQTQSKNIGGKAKKFKMKPTL